jgi:hypothetical protein
MHGPGTRNSTYTYLCMHKEGPVNDGFKCKERMLNFSFDGPSSKYINTRSPYVCAALRVEGYILYCIKQHFYVLEVLLRIPPVCTVCMYDNLFQEQIHKRRL